MVQRRERVLRGLYKGHTDFYKGKSVKALEFRTGHILTDDDIRNAVEHSNSVIHYDHRDKDLTEARIFHKAGTVYVSGGFNINHIENISPCHAMMRNGRYDGFLHRVRSFCHPHAFLLGCHPEYVLSNYPSKYRVKRRAPDLTNKTIYCFRTLPQYWIDWECLFLTLQLRGEVNA